MRWFALLLLLPLSGCFGAPEIPDDAIIGTDGDVRLSSWTEMRGSRLQFHAVAENVGGEDLEIRTGCGEPWQSLLMGPDGAVDYVEVQEPAGCAAYWDSLRTGGNLEFLHSWDFQGHDPETGASWTLPGGEYVWRLQFWLRDDLTFVETRIPIQVPCSDKNPCGNVEGIVLEVESQSRVDGETLRANLTNEGNATVSIHELCGEPWRIQLFHNGKAVSYDDTFTCQAFRVGEFPPGASMEINVAWNRTLQGEPAPPGDYLWRVQANVGTDAGGPLVETARFVL